MNNRTFIKLSLQQSRLQKQRKAPAVLHRIALRLFLVIVFYFCNPLLPIQLHADTAKAVAAVGALEEQIAISPQCSAETERWYIAVNYRYLDATLDTWRLRFALATEGDDTWREYFTAIVHRASESFSIYPHRLPSIPTMLIVDGNEERVHIDSVACRPYQPFPSDNNREAIPYIDTSTITTQNDFPGVVYQGQPQDFLLYRWDHFPTMLIVDTADYNTLGLLFNRLAFFIEKNGAAGTLYSDQELEGRFAWNGHNYNAADLALFYNSAQEQNVTLNRYETTLRALLLSIGVLQRTDTSSDEQYVAGEGGVVAISQQSGTYVRRLILQHELLHATFYADEEFRKAVEEVWFALSAQERLGWRAMLGHLTYDPENEYVMINEFQAYLLAKTASASVAQMTSIAQTVLRSATSSADEREGLTALIKDDSRSMRDSASQLSALLTAYSGLAAGTLRNIETQ